MTDINNNFNADSLSKIHNLHYGNSKDLSVNGEIYHQEKEIKNLDNDHAALVGRSMIKRMKKPQLPKLNPEVQASIKAALNEFKQNPEVAAKADVLFAAALKKGYSYEQATAIAKEFFATYSE